MKIRRVVLTGLSGSGKSTVGIDLARQLGWSLIDTDLEIERRTGTSVPEIFATQGEPAFRAIEGKVVREALSRDDVVIATGGGAVLDPLIWSDDAFGAPDVLTVWLDASPEELARRVELQGAADGQAAFRPLLGSGDVLARMQTMRRDRLPMYTRSQVTLGVAGRSPESLASDVSGLVRLGCGEPGRVDLVATSAPSRIDIGVGVAGMLPAVIRERWPKAQTVFVMVDGHVRPHVDALLARLREESTARVAEVEVEPGEGSKSLDGAGRAFDAIFEAGVERGDVIVALGGGVVGDLAGFVAATVLRGIGLVQVPTTLLSMVDSSVGGKTGINHPTGKNLIGAFYQPPRVLIDPALLGSLPDREFVSGWGEIVKHAIIEASTPVSGGATLLDVLERNSAALLRREEPLLTWVIQRNVAIKASVVEADERESGLRAILNFGHTIGHGVEAAGYHHLHGEAVAIGVAAALALSRTMGMIDEAFETRCRDLLVSFGLPVQSDRVRIDEVRHHMQHDKKKQAGSQRWVLATMPQGVQIRSDVPEAMVEAAIASVVKTG